MLNNIPKYVYNETTVENDMIYTLKEISHLH